MRRGLALSELRADKMTTRWYHQSAELLFEHNDDDNKEYLVGVYIPAFDPELGSVQALEQSLQEFEKKGKVIKDRDLESVIKLFTTKTI
jgi:hypothetical protein